MTLQLDVICRRLSHSNARFLCIILPMAIFIGLYCLYASSMNNTPPTVAERVMGEIMKENNAPLKTFKTKDLVILKDSDKLKSKEKLKLHFTSAEAGSNVGHKEEEKEEEKGREDAELEKEEEDEAHRNKNVQPEVEVREIGNPNVESETKESISEGDAKEEFHPKDLFATKTVNKGKSKEEKQKSRKQEVKTGLNEDDKNEPKEDEAEKTDVAEEPIESEMNANLTKIYDTEEKLEKTGEKSMFPKSSEKKNIDEMTVEKVYDKAKNQMDQKIQKLKSREEIALEKTGMIQTSDIEHSEKMKSREILQKSSKKEEVPKESKDEREEDDGLVA